MNILTLLDFSAKGKFELHTGMYDAPRVQEYIDKYEKRYLIQLLGFELFQEFEADLILGSGTPTEPRFIAIFDALGIDKAGCVIYSEGFKEMLKGFIYYEYAKDLINQMTPIGNVLPTGENSDKATTLYSMMFTRYNDAAASYKTIQYYICHNKEGFDFSKFSGNPKGFVYWI
jgi:hypothetical protein